MTWTQRSWPRIICLFCFVFLCGCSSQPASPPPVSPLNLVPYFTPTSAWIPTATLPATETPSPTPTPQIYAIAAGDTFSKLALRFGVSIAALQTANPGVQPAALTVGQTLVIPAADETNLPETFLPTPMALELGPVDCFSTVGGQTCLAPVHNSNPETLENIQVQILLLGPDGQTLQSQTALLPLNILQPGQSLPASAFFENTASFPALAQLRAALPVRPDDPRYLKTRVDNLLVSIGWNGRFAQVEGLVILAEDAPPAKTLWVAATAYQADGQMIGFRRWEWTGVLPAGQAQPFSCLVYSLGPKIDRVEIQVEARP